MLEKWQPPHFTRGSPRKADRPSAVPSRVPAGPHAPSPAPSPAPEPALVRASTSFGEVPWSVADVRESLDAFLAFYAARPAGEFEGMNSAGHLGVWFLLGRIRPELVIECGVGRGLTTWVLEHTLPGAQLVCLDKDFSRRRYESGKAIYLETGFLEADLVPEGEVALALFDDHGDALPRIRKCRDLGIRHVLFDDNYPEPGGHRHRSLAAALRDKAGMAPEDASLLEEALDAYYVFPPVYDWDEPVTLERSLILEPSLLGPRDPAGGGALEPLARDMAGYRWLTYARLR